MSEIPKDFHFRADGRLERDCPHGIGHTVFAPKIKQDDGSFHENWTHGCDGCCRYYQKFSSLEQIKEVTGKEWKPPRWNALYRWFE